MRRLLKIAGWLVLLLAALVTSIFIVLQVTPWPASQIIRYTFEKEAATTAKALEKHLPSGIVARLDERYDSADSDALLDVYFPSRVERDGTALTTIVWIHGGGWVSGSKREIGNYARILAGQGFTVVSIDYSLAPGATFPKPIRQTNKALAYLATNAKHLHIDPQRFVLAGDSGGAQIAAATANVIAVPDYARLLGIVPAIARPQLAGMLLYCGAYTTAGINLEGAFGGFLKTVLWSYSGKKDFLNDAAFARAWIADRISADFPPAFISAGNADPLLLQSTTLADALSREGVNVETLFFPADYQPPLPHEYQFNLDTEAGQAALARSVDFLRNLPR
jgi:acetyl esterase/lipase